MTSQPILKKSEPSNDVAIIKDRLLEWGKLGEDLPEIVNLRSGARIETQKMQWNFIDGVIHVSMNFAALPFQVTPLVNSLKRVLIQALEENSPRYAENLFRTFKRFSLLIEEQGDEAVTEITESHVANFIAKYLVGDKLGLEAQLSALLVRWSKLNGGGLSEAAFKLLVKRKKKGNVKGEAVMTFDPISGPLTEYELQQLISELNNAYSEKLIDKQFYHLTWLAILTGQRVSQYCALKVKDLVQVVDEFGDVTYEIKIPKAKQQGEVVRESFLSRPLNLQFGQSLWKYAQEVRFQNRRQDTDAPLFPSDVNHHHLEQINPDFQGHWHSSELSTAFHAALSSIAPVSPRTHEAIKLPVGRFRYTLGTRAAQEGFGELIIAEILGHSDTQNVGSYVAAIPEIASRLDEQLARDLVPISNAFMGVILIQREDATRAGDTSSYIIDYRSSKKGVGNCGTKFDCTFDAPVSCYTCRNFEAWLDAPHEQILQRLVKKRQDLLETSGPRVAAINDLTIVAIQQVIDECSRIKNSIAN